MSRRPYVRSVSKTTWYFRQQRYRSYMLRELTCLLVAFYCVLMLVGLAALAPDQADRWNAFLAGQQQPGWIAFHALSLVFFTLYQTMAWFRLAPKAMTLHIGPNRVPAGAVIAAHYLGWVLCSLFVLWLAGVF